jgi:hypothetical protein
MMLIDEIGAVKKTAGPSAPPPIPFGDGKLPVRMIFLTGYGHGGNAMAS